MQEKKKFEFKKWLDEKKTKVKDFCSKHPDVVLTVVGGFASIIGGCLRLYANKSEYEDYLYTTVDDEVYKLPAKEMRTAKRFRKNKKD